MKNLIYLAIIATGGYFLWPYIEPPIFNALPKEIRRRIFSVEVPAAFRGKYVSDLKTNENWKWQFNLNLHSKELMNKPAGKQAIEIGAWEMRIPILGRTVTDQVELVRKGKDFIVLEYYDTRVGKVGQRAVQRDDTGLWVADGEGKKGTVTHYTPR